MRLLPVIEEEIEHYEEEDYEEPSCSTLGIFIRDDEVIWKKYTDFCWPNVWWKQL